MLTNPRTALPNPAVSAGFTLIELLVVLAIIGILAVIAVPQYLEFTRRARFTEIVSAAAPLRLAVDSAVQTQLLASAEDLDSGTAGLPAAIAADATTHGASVTDGVLSLTWMADGSNLAGITYTLTPSGIVPPVRWTAGGSCVAQNLC